MKQFNIDWKLFLPIMILVFISCSDDNDDTSPLLEQDFERGAFTSSEIQTSVTKENVQTIANLVVPTAPFTMLYDVDVYSVEYFTVDGKNNEQLASGALFLPKNRNDLPLVSLQHGTETKSDAVASVIYTRSFEGVGGLVFASLGYATVIPDYLGFGVSDIDHPYMLSESITPSVVDFIRAGRKLSISKSINLNGDVFLTGYSEGGYVTLATQKDIEENYNTEIILTAVAPMAGPYDFVGTVDSILTVGEYSTPYYIAYVLKSYDEFYGWNKLNHFFKTPYNTSVSSLFDGSKEYDVVISQLPGTLDGLLTNEFVNSYNSGLEPELRTSLIENSLLDWTPTAPIHFFHGDSDEVVPYINAVKAIDVFSSRGTIVELTTIFGGTHSSSVTVSMVGAIEWFETFK